ncbi:MAG: histidinol-phosphate transaminase [Gammaproteobacteria bacterium]|nr:histidinol-phosphate transaminase [Gammaproteobacteria bacterium]
MRIDFRHLANSSLQNLIPYQPGKPIEELERELGITSSIKLASNENPLGASSLAIQAMQAALRDAHIYPDGSCYDLKNVLAQRLEIQSNQITVGNGSENILELIVKAYLHKGDTAIISEYAFLTIPILLQSYGVSAKVIPAELWGHNIKQMVAAIDEKTRVLFLVNPNNPTGTYTNAEDFQYLLDHVPQDVLIVVDEAYSEYITLADYPNTLALLHNYPNVVLTRTFSKVYGLAALRLGYSVSSPEIADMLNRARLPFNVNSIAIKAACAALSDADHLNKSLQLNITGMQQIEDYLKQHQIPYIPSIGNFITVDVGNGLSVYQKFLLEGVIIRPLQAYHMPRHIRITIGTQEQNERFLRAFHHIM